MGLFVVSGIEIILSRNNYSPGVSMAGNYSIISSKSYLYYFLALLTLTPPILTLYSPTSNNSLETEISSLNATCLGFSIENSEISSMVLDSDKCGEIYLGNISIIYVGLSTTVSYILLVALVVVVALINLVLIDCGLCVISVSANSFMSFNKNNTFLWNNLTAQYINVDTE